MLNSPPPSLWRTSFPGATDPDHEVYSEQLTGLMEISTSCLATEIATGKHKKARLKFEIMFFQYDFPERKIRTNYSVQGN